MLDVSSVVEKLEKPFDFLCTEEWGEKRLREQCRCVGDRQEWPVKLQKQQGRYLETPFGDGIRKFFGKLRSRCAFRGGGIEIRVRRRA